MSRLNPHVDHVEMKMAHQGHHDAARPDDGADRFSRQPRVQSPLGRRLGGERAEDVFGGVAAEQERQRGIAAVFDGGDDVGKITAMPTSSVSTAAGRARNMSSR